VRTHEKKKNFNKIKKGSAPHIIIAKYNRKRQEIFCANQPIFRKYILKNYAISLIFTIRVAKSDKNR
jgi:hypothetical protein